MFLNIYCFFSVAFSKHVRRAEEKLNYDHASNKFTFTYAFTCIICQFPQR